MNAASAIVEPILADNEIPWAQRGNYIEEYLNLRRQVETEGAKLAVLFVATTGYCYGASGCGSNIYWVDSASLLSTTEKRITTVRFELVPSSEPHGYFTSTPIPIFFSFVEDPDLPTSQWETNNFQYCSQGPDDSAEELMAAYDAGLLATCVMSGSGLEWTNTNPVEPLHPDSAVPEPKTFHTAGPSLSSGIVWWQCSQT